jgi:N6-L-threonylcarbamoyladenine synthase
MKILAIETSCDDTGIAILESGEKKHQVLANVVSSQIKTHAPFGGVVPNLAAREHLKNILPCLKQVFFEAKSAGGRTEKKIDLIATTIGPGLIPSLLVGTNFAKALAYQWQKPIIGVNHMAGHVFANFIDNPQIKLPGLCVIVSGGHTQLVLMKSTKDFKLIGETRDDAAGEAFDKVAKLLNLGYPGGPIISKKALEGNKEKINLPRPMLDKKNFEFSFSGLKTAVLYERLKEKNIDEKYVNDMAASFQQAVIDVLVKKAVRAAKEYKLKTVMLSGGVAANPELRKQLSDALKKDLPQVEFFVPQFQYCTDNGAMIACAAYYQYKNLKKKISWPSASWRIEADANLRLV